MKVKRNFWFLAGGIILVALLYNHSAATSGCVGDKNPQNYCFQGQLVSFSCVDGVKQESTTSCPPSKACFEGVCLPEACTSTTYTCRDSYSYIKQECSGSTPVNTVFLCPSGSYCTNQTGKCQSSTAICGNSICESEETTESCARDCSVLSSWTEYNREVANNPALQADLVCVGEIDCDNPIVQRAIEDIEKSADTSSPIKFIDATTDFVHKLIQYQTDGGLEQCGESASSLLTSYYANQPTIGNCVDFSSLETTILRARGIVSTQVGVCVFQGWTCTPFAIVGGKPIQAGSINEQQAIGHAIVKVYAGKDLGFVTADPTVGRSVSSSCVSYSQTLTENPNGGQTCFIPNNLYDEYCQK